MQINGEISLEVGDSFLLRNEFGTHLHVIVAEYSPDPHSQVMLVYASSRDNVPFKDITTIIVAGEHPFITTESWIRYQNILIKSRLEVKPFIIEFFGKITENLLTRIQKGINTSDFVSGQKKDMFNEWVMDNLFRKINS